MVRNRPIVGLVASKRQAERILTALEGAGLLREDLSVLFLDNPSSRGSAGQKNAQVPQGAPADAGKTLGGSLGPLAAVSAITVPGADPFLATGPLMLALRGAAAGAGQNGIAAALVTVGVHELEAQQYEARIQGGGVLVSVHVDDHEERLLAKTIFIEGGVVFLSAEGEHGLSNQQRAASNLGRLNR